MPAFPPISKLVLRAAIGIAVVCLALIVTQDVQIHPGIFLDEDPNAPLPKGVTRFSAPTEDNETLDVWRLEAPARDERPLTAVIMHGNFGTVRSFFPIQRWFQEQGIVSYDFDYRGYGMSTGWPSESGLYHDSSAVWRLIQQQEKIEPHSLVIFGLSIGTGVASELAARLKPAALILVAPYTNLKEVAAQRLFIRPLLPFLRYRLPTEEYVVRLENTCLLLAHARNDTVIPFEHSRALQAAYRGKKKVERFVSENAGHNFIFNDAKKQLAAWLGACLSRKS